LILGGQVAVAASGCGDDRSAHTTRAAVTTASKSAAPRHREQPKADANAHAIFLNPVDGTGNLLRVPGLGRFVVRCPKSNRLHVTFVSQTDQGLYVLVDVNGGRPKALVVNPGKRLRLPRAPGKTLTQRWQLFHRNEADSAVTLAFITSTSARSIGSPGCIVSGYALGPTLGS
jgi:hypothetical protein